MRDLITLFTLGTPLWALVVRSAVIYLALLIGLRLSGKRELGQATLFDLIVILVVTNAIQPAVTGPDSSLLGGLVIMATLFFLNAVIGRLNQIPAFARLVTPQPTVIIKDGQYLEAALRREKVSKSECEMAIREHGLADVSEVKLAVLEADGTVSIVPADGQLFHTRRRIKTGHRW